MGVNEIEQLIQFFSKLPGLGPRSARRAALHLIKNKESLLKPLGLAMEAVAEKIQTCLTCGNLDSENPCSICTNVKRDRSIICVVEEVADLWALERSEIYRGSYHVLGGVLSPLDGIGPDDLMLDGLLARAEMETVAEIILATSATIEGQTTAHYIQDSLKDTKVKISKLAQGLPIGGEIEFLDDGTLFSAFKNRGPVTNR